MAHPNIDERRAFVAGLLNNGVKIDNKIKREIAKKFNCHVSAIYADLKYFEKTKHHIDEYRAFVADLFNNGVKIDSKIKCEIAKKFNFNISDVYTDLRYFEKTKHQQKISSENSGNSVSLNSFKLINDRSTSVSLCWQSEIAKWVNRHDRHERLPNSLSNSLILFFELVFKHTFLLDKTSFETYEKTMNLVVAGISLVKVNLSNTEYGVWVILDRNSMIIPKVEYKSAKFIQECDSLIWAHLHDIKDINLLLENSEFWLSYSHASNKVINSLISRTRNEEFPQSGHQQCLNEFLSNSLESQNNLVELKNEQQRIETEGYFNVENLEDARRRITASIVQRQGQFEFRRKLLIAYGSKCSISGCDVEPAIEAAHIFPYKGTQTNHITNGLPLRADIHTLFDLYLLSIQPYTYEIIIANKLIGTCYQEFAGQKLTLPKDEFALPSREALRQHYEQFLQKHNE